MRFIAVILFTLFSLNTFAEGMPTINLNGLMQQVKSHDSKTMVVFWAPWCPFCMRELKVIRDNPEFVKENNLQIIALTKRPDKGRAIAFVEKEKMPFRFFIAEQEIYDKLQRIDAVPLTLVYNNEGKLLDFEYGKQDIDDLALMLEDY